MIPRRTPYARTKHIIPFDHMLVRSNLSCQEVELIGDDGVGTDRQADTATIAITVKTILTISQALPNHDQTAREVTKEVITPAIVICTQLLRFIGWI
jgi:hypothetical protein